MADRKKDALERLRVQVEAAQNAARSNRLWAMDVPALRDLAATHKLGDNANGWVNPYPKADPRSLLLEYQFNSFHDRSRFKASLQSRQTGKDFVMQGEAVEDCHARPGTKWMFAAPSERQSVDSLEQGKIWAEAFDLAIADYTEQREGAGSQTLLKSAEITFSNGSQMLAVPGKPDTVRGKSANIGLTEFDFFENPGATWRAILPSITNPLRGGEKKVRIVTTPNGKGGAMHKIWTKEPSAKMAWSKHLVTIYHAVLMGLPVDIEQLREAMDDPEGWAQECECEFLDSSNVLLPYDIIALAESAEAHEFCDPAFWTYTGSGLGPVTLGIDFGRTNDPTVCWALEKVGDVQVTREVLAERGMSTPDQESMLEKRIRRASRVCFDYTGPGIGLGDYLVRKHGEWKPEAEKFGKIELCTFTAGFKREIFPRLRRAFEAPVKIRVPISIAVREDLHAMKQIVRNGEYSYAAPRTSEGHSDRCTALALALRAAGDGFINPGRFGRVRKGRGARAARAIANRRNRSATA
ncbi:MAG: terminase family protein [Opitutaceae bacterium]|jgi:phage FluMu gp28-like protein